MRKCIICYLSLLCRMFLLSNGTLQITQVKPRNTGTYKCVGRGLKGSAVTQEASLLIAGTHINTHAPLNWLEILSFESEMVIWGTCLSLLPPILQTSLMMMRLPHWHLAQLYPLHTLYWRMLLLFLQIILFFLAHWAQQASSEVNSIKNNIAFGLRQANRQCNYADVHVECHETEFCPEEMIFLSG